jgi:phage FluMu protein gp41
MRTEITVPLITGLWQGGHWQARATLRALTGADEALLLEAGAMLPAQRVTALLAAATLSIGDIAPVSYETVRSLTIGDRERLMFALHAISFGAQIDVVVNCAQASCGERIELPLDLTELLAAPAHVPGTPGHALTVATTGGALHVRFRLPNGADQEAAARLAGDLARAGDRLLARCIVAVADEQGRAVPAESAIEQLRAPLVDAFRALDPAAETVATIECPACGHATAASLDAYTLLAGELARTEQILLDVSRLARAHHWSEAEILALPVARRRRYLALLAEGMRA